MYFPSAWPPAEYRPCDTRVLAGPKPSQEKYTPTVYMHTQMDINCKMRAILIDWIVEVHLKFKLADPTLYLTCHIIDRFCMQENVHRSKLQLVGVTALLIACKYEEIFPTEVGNGGIFFGAVCARLLALLDFMVLPT